MKIIVYFCRSCKSVSIAKIWQKYPTLKKILVYQSVLHITPNNIMRIWHQVEKPQKCELFKKLCSQIFDCSYINVYLNRSLKNGGKTYTSAVCDEKLNLLFELQLMVRGCLVLKINIHCSSSIYTYRNSFHIYLSPGSDLQLCGNRRRNHSKETLEAIVWN